MKTIVLDASVVAAAFFPEPCHDRARAILAFRRNFCAPDLLLAEVGNVVWKRHRRGELTDEEAESLIDDLLGLSIEFIPAAALVGQALPLAIRTGRTVYDCLYLVLAARHDAIMVTADRRLATALAGTPMSAHVEWIGKP